MFIEILFKMLLFKGGVLIYAEYCNYIIHLEPKIGLTDPLMKWGVLVLFSAAG